MGRFCERLSDFSSDHSSDFVFVCFKFVFTDLPKPIKDIVIDG